MQKYGTPLYITSVADYTADYQIPALRAGGVEPEDVILVSADGNKSAYERIRAGGQYQLVTASEPYEMQAYQAIDELNRAFDRRGAERLRADALPRHAGQRRRRRRRPEHLHPEQRLREEVPGALGHQRLTLALLAGRPHAGPALHSRHDWRRRIGVSRPAAGSDMLKITGLTKRFSGTLALDSVDLDVRAGEVHALLGENGAGKSTLIKILAGVHQADGGTIEMHGRARRSDVRRACRSTSSIRISAWSTR